MILCQRCGAQYSEDSEYPAYYFSSASFPVGSYTTPKAIALAAEDMLTCPKDEGQPPEEYPTASTPAGGDMYQGDDRYTSGDETEPLDPDEPADATHQP
jgi:hypothetical protein